MLDTSALALHSNKPSRRQKPTTTNKQKSPTKSIISPSYCGQGFKSAMGIQKKQRSCAYCAQNTGLWRTEIPESLYGPHSWQRPCFDRYLLSDYSFSMCCAPVWELEEDGRLFSRCHFLSQCTWVIFKPFKKKFPVIDTGLYRKKMSKKLWFLPDKHMKGFQLRMTNTLFFHQTEKDPW